MIIEDQEIYIEPNIYLYNSLDEVKKDSFWRNEQRLTVDEVVDKKKQYCYVIGDPGYGKSRLMQEIVLKDHNAIYIDLKKLRDKSIVEYIASKESIDCAKFKVKDISKKGYFVSNNFTLNSQLKATLYLDAIDEISREFLSTFIDNLDEFIELHKNCHIVLSGRTHNVNNIKNLIPDSNSWSVIKIDKFYGEQITKFIKEYISDLTDENINKLVSSTSTPTINYFQFTGSILQIPRYLKLGIELLSQDIGFNLKNISRIDLFDRFIKGKLIREKENINHVDPVFLRKFLSQLALIMEIKQTNHLTKDEFAIILDELQSDIKNFIFKELSPDDFFRHSLLKDNVDTIEFENREFQEYLAASEMFAFNSIEQIVYDLCYVSAINDFNMSWYNTLSYVIEKFPLLLINITSRQISSNNIPHSFISFILANIKEESIHKIPNEDSMRIFNMILNSHSKCNRELPMKDGKNLALLYQGNGNDLFILLKECNEDNTNALANIFTLLLALYNRNKDLLKWDKEIIVNVCNQHRNNVKVLYYGLPVLAIFKDESLIKKFEFVFENITNESNDKIGAFFSALDVFNDNNLKIKYVIKYYRSSDRTFNAPFDTLYSVLNSSVFVLKLMQGFASCPGAFVNFIESLQYKSTSLESKLEERINENSDILKPVETIIHNLIKPELTSDDIIDNDLIAFLVKKVVDRNPSFSISTMGKIFSNPNYYIYNYTKLISNLLNVDNLEDCIQLIKKSDKNYLLNLVFEISEKTNPGIYQLRQKFIEEMPVYNKTKTSAFSVIKAFKERLWVGEGEFRLDVFHYYERHYEEIEKVVSEEQKARFKSLLKVTLDRADVSNTIIRFNNKDGNERNYTITATNYYHCLKSIVQIKNLKELININDYRKDLLAFISSADHINAEAIYELLKPLTLFEIKKISEDFLKVDDDRYIIHLQTFLSFVKKFTIVDALPVLKGFIDNDSDKIHTYELTEILKTIRLFEKSKGYYLSILEFVDHKKYSELWFFANTILIDDFRDKDAIETRCKEIKQRKFKYIEPTQCYSPRGMANIISNEVAELRDFTFALPLMKINSPNFKDFYLDLLDFSIDIENQNIEYRAYADYVKGIVAAYFKNLKMTKDYSYIDLLSKQLDSRNKKERHRWFLDDIRKEYVNYIEGNKSLTHYIKTYNNQKEKKYIDISTVEDLSRIVEDVINKDLRKWVEVEGAYKMIRNYKIVGAKKQTTEDLMQKTLVAQFENILLRKGLREFDIVREVQLLDDKRIDLLIKYGFIGNIMVEIKRSGNADFCSGGLDYKDKLEKYLYSSNSQYGFYVIFNESVDKDKFQKQISEHKEMYCNSKIGVIGIDCMVD